MRTMDTETITQIVVAVLAAMAQPAETATQAVVSVANKAAKVTGQRRIAPAIRAKVKTLRWQNGGPLHSHDPTWKLIDDGIVDAQGNLIVGAKAPTATKTTVTQTALTHKQLMRLTKAELAAKLLA